MESALNKNTKNMNVYHKKKIVQIVHINTLAGNLLSVL